jgi:hypothetical protein
MVDSTCLHISTSFNTTFMSDSIRIPDSIDSRRLEAMQIIAKMKEAADRNGIGFVGGFVDDNGEKFVMTNMDDDDTNMLMPDNLRN